MNALHFDASRPVEGDLFVNRVAELRRLDAALSKLRAGRADYLSVMGLRKQGSSRCWRPKTSSSRKTSVTACAIPATRSG